MALLRIAQVLTVGMPMQCLYILTPHKRKKRKLVLTTIFETMRINGRPVPT